MGTLARPLRFQDRTGKSAHPPTENHNMLNISQTGALDFLSLGALVHRLDTGIIPFRKANKCDIHVSGGEFNVSANHEAR